jgi:hypothetical protein
LALITKSRLFDWIVMPFGIQNVINMFSMTTMEVFKTHMDKLLNVHNMSWEEHLEHLQYLFMRLTKMNLKFNLEKCEFVKSNLIFLNHVMNKDGT